MKNYHSVATPIYSQTATTCDCYVKASSIKEAREIFKVEFKNVGRITLSKYQNA
jgi:hypothetical protein